MERVSWSKGRDAKTFSFVKLKTYAIESESGEIEKNLKLWLIFEILAGVFENILQTELSFSIFLTFYINPR
jgi:hypothetical protein